MFPVVFNVLIKISESYRPQNPTTTIFSIALRFMTDTPYSPLSSTTSDMSPLAIKIFSPKLSMIISLHSLMTTVFLVGVA